MPLSIIVRRLAATGLAGGLMLASTPAGAQSAPLPTPNYAFGAVEANLAVPQASRLGIGWTRVPLPWASLQPAPGVWNYHYTNNDQALLTLAGDGIVPVGVVETVPAWASVNAAQAPDGVPRGLSLPWNNPGNYWGQYMYQLARHYAGLINTWIIGNEISIRSGPAKSWDGTVAHMAEMIRIASLAVHAANPMATVQAPGAPYWYDQGATTNALLTDLARLPGAKAHHDFIDGLNLHLYNTLQWNSLVYGQYRQMLRRHGLGWLPIWLSETNAAPGAPEQPRTTPADQADFLTENLAASLQYVSHEEVFQMTTPARAQVAYGLVGANGSTGPAYQAVKTLITALSGTRFLHAAVLPYEWQARSTPAVVTFGGVRRLINVVWDQGFRPTTIRLPAYGRHATVILPSGAAHTVSANGRHVVLRLPASTLHSASTPTDAPIGGTPFIVVQTVGLGQAGTPTIAPVNAPSEFAGSAPLLTATGDGETAQVNPKQATVHITTPSGSVTVGGWGTGSGQLLGPSGVAIGPTGTVYVTNAGANDVVAYTPGGQVLTTWGSYGTQPGHFNGPSGIAIGPHGSVYVADTLNQRVQKFSPTGQYQGEGPATWPTTVKVTSTNHWTYGYVNGAS